MARLEKYSGTQQLGGVRRPGVIADTAVGQATAAAGGQIQRTGAQVGHIAELAQQRQLKIDDFQRKKGWLDFEGQFSQKELEAQQNLKPGAAGYTKSMQAQFDTDAAKFIESLPDSAKAQAEIDVKNLRNRYTDRFTRTEQKESTRYFQEGIAEGSDQIAKNIRANPNTYDEALEQGRSLINESGLPRIEKEAALKAWERMASIAWVETLPAAERAQLFGASRVDAGSLIRAKEGFRTKAYPDTGGHDGKQFSGYRVGYGSDTVTRADGSVEKVTKDTVITQADAERDLERRLGEFQATAMKQVGAEAWQRLPPRAQAALTSIVYNYGELPKRLHSAVQSGDIEQIAGAVEGLKSDNGGVNSKRRQEEANIIRGHAAIPNASPEIQERLDSLSYEDQVKLSDQANRDLVSVASDRQDGFRLQIATDPLTVDRQQIIDDPMLDDGQKASLINSLNSALKQGEKVRNAIDWVNTSGNGNPLNPDDRNNADLVYEQMVENEQATPDQAANTVAASKGVLPKPYLTDVLNGTGSRNAEEVLRAHQRAAAALTLYPDALRGTDDAEKVAEAARRWQFQTLEAGQSPEVAAARLAALNDPEQRKANEALRESKEVKDTLKKIDAAFVEGQLTAGYAKVPLVGGVLGAAGYAVGDTVSPTLGWTPQQRSEGVLDFKDLFVEGMVLEGGDKDAALNWATEKFQRTWQTSEFFHGGDDVLTKYPAELLNGPVNGSWEYLHEQAVEALKENGTTDYQNYWFEHVREPRTGRNTTLAEMQSGRVPAMILKYRDMDGKEQFVPVAFRGDPERAQAEHLADLATEQDRESSVKAARVNFKQRQRAYQEALSDFDNPDRQQAVETAYRQLEASRDLFAETVDRVQSERRQVQLSDRPADDPSPRTLPLDAVRQQSDQIKLEKGL